MSKNEPNDEKGFVDKRPNQDSLIKDPDVVNRPEKESQVDRGASDKFQDDRNDVDKNEPSSKQSGLEGDFNQKDLNGDRTGPEWF